MKCEHYFSPPWPELTGRKALITGITGQDGSYLAEFLLSKGYEVWGVVRRSSSITTWRIDHLYEPPWKEKKRLNLVYGDLNDASSLNRILKTVRPDEIYNLGAQSHVQVSFEIPEYTAEVVGVGSVRLLEAMRELGLDARFYQASSSELFGKVVESPQKESTPFYPRSPYAAAKAYAFYITRNYREAYGMYTSNGILFNHESPRRGETFVTRKITRALSRISLGLQDCLYLGNLNAKRDWGHAKDYVRMQWMMLQQEAPQDFVIATGVQYSVREFVAAAAEKLGLELSWQGEQVEEVGIDKSTGRTIVRVDPRYFRPTEVETLLGDPTKAKTELGWVPEISFDQLVGEMVEEDLALAKRDALVAESGFKTFSYHE